MTPHDRHDSGLGVGRQDGRRHPVTHDTSTARGDRILSPRDRGDLPNLQATEGGFAIASPQDAREVLGQRPLPVAQLADKRQKSFTYLVVTAMDASGRLADRTPLLALRWLRGQPVMFAANSPQGIFVVRRGGREAITGQGHLRIPARIRHILQLTAGERLLVAALVQHDLLIVHTVAAVDAMMLTYHATINRREAS